MGRPGGVFPTPGGHYESELTSRMIPLLKESASSLKARDADHPVA